MANLNWLDISALLIIAVCSLDGLLKGFVISVFNIAGFVVAILVAKAAAPGLALYIAGNTSIDDTISNYIVAKYNNISSGISPALKIFGNSKLGFENVLTSEIVLVLSFFLAFILAKIVLSVIANILDTAARLPVIKQFNRLGGFFFGALKGVFILYILFAVFTFIVPLFSPSNIILTSLDGSVFASNFYRYNFILPWINGKML